MSILWQDLKNDMFYIISDFSEFLGHSCTRFTLNFLAVIFNRYFIPRYFYFRLVVRVRQRAVRKVRHLKKMDMSLMVVKKILKMKVSMTNLKTVIPKGWDSCFSKVQDYKIDMMKLIFVDCRNFVCQQNFIICCMDSIPETSQNVAPASMWTRRDIQDFKESIRREGGDSVIKVGHGETVTVSFYDFFSIDWK